MSLGANVGFVDELYNRFRADPASVSDAWRDFFADYQPPVGEARAPSPAEGPAPTPTPAPAARPPAAAGAERLTGAAARIAENMTESLQVPTATSARTVPVKLLEENRRIINEHQRAVHGAKISFTHLLAWAIVRAFEKHPVMNSEYVDVDGKPHRRDRAEVNLGLAVDVEKRGQRLLVVPCIKGAARLSFAELVRAHDDLATRARQGKLQVDDLTGTTVTLTNPGMLGTAMSVPRLMPGQGTIVGIGKIDYPPEYTGMSPRVISELGLAKVMTVTSTYDHRIIQGAESGAFLADLEQLLLGADRFYERIYADLGVAQEPLAWAPDQNPGLGADRGDYEAIAKQAAVAQLIRAYRVRGHLWADLNPLGFAPQPQPELELASYGLSMWDLDRRFVSGGLQGRHELTTLRQILGTLRRAYCGRVGVEFMHIPESELREWLIARVEAEPAPLSRAARLRLLDRLNAAEAFERFLHSAYVGQKRFSLEGAEALIPALDTLLNAAAASGVAEAVIGMAHRGRLNVLANTLGKSVGSIFREFEGELDPALSHGSGDVKYHIGARGTHQTPEGTSLALVLASNPSHLEAVNPVVEGMVRARQERRDDRERTSVLPVLIHGDAAFSGQGVVAETFGLSQLPGYRTGGTIHLVVNNQIGFTAAPESLRSSLYATDVAKIVRAPIFHVNGDHPEEVVRVVEIAHAFRQRFRHDVVIDLICYRRWGHNEGDDPSYTSPILYAKIKNQRSVRKLYTEELMRRGELDAAAAEQALEDFRLRLQAAHDEVTAARRAQAAAQPLAPGARQGPPDEPAVRTAAPAAMLEQVLEGLARLPEGFAGHPKLLPQLARRRERFTADRVDWALGEALAFGTLVLEGTPVRLSGEDSGRGTFSQRHAVLYDVVTGRPHVPLANLHAEQAPFHVFDSLLSEFAVLGFEYGYSVEAPRSLVLWEAQFGDFANGAQVIIDQFIASAEDKWGQRSGLVLLLPHGYEGQGPEHSSARIERYLQLCAEENLRVANPTTPAQIFHLLRRQAKAARPVPLVVFTPKSLLRHPQAVSPAAAFVDGAFAPVLDDDAVTDAAAVRRVVLSSGKLYYDLAAARGAAPGAVALVRVEQLYPFPADEVAGLLRRYGRATEVVWAQEEPANMGPWSFVADRLQPLCGADQRLVYAGRPPRPSPATGSSLRHQAEQEAVVREALGG